jgi:uncharacterized protein
MDSTIQNFSQKGTQDPAELAFEEREGLQNKFFDNVVEKKDLGAFLVANYEDDYLRFYHRPKEPMSETIGLNGCCIPGARRLFVTVEGELHVCERLDNGYPIGDVDQWIDNRLVEKIVADYIKMSKECLECWACRLCSTCFAQLAVGGRFDREFRKKECVAIRNRWHRMLVQYYSLLERDETAWDYLKEKTLE